MFLSPSQRQRIRGATGSGGGNSGKHDDNGASMSDVAAAAATAKRAGLAAGSSSGSGGTRAGGGRRGVNLLRVGTEALRRELEAREAREAANAAGSANQQQQSSDGGEAPEAAAAAGGEQPAEGSSGSSGGKRKAPFNWQQFVRPKTRIFGQTEPNDNADEADASAGAAGAGAAHASSAASAPAPAPMTDVWADEVQTQDVPAAHKHPLVNGTSAPVAFSQPDPTTDLTQDYGGGEAQQQQHQAHPPQSVLFAGGAPINVALPHMTMQASAYTHVLQAHQQHEFNSHYTQQQWQGRLPAGGRRGRAIRTPHAMPGLHQIDLSHSPAAAAAPAQVDHFHRAAAAPGMPMLSPQLAALFAAQAPPHGHPPSYYGATNSGGGGDDGGVVDLTQDTEAYPGSQEDDVQVLSVTQGAPSSSATDGYTYNAFNPAFSQAPSAAYSYDAYASAFRNATASTTAGSATSLWPPAPSAAPSAPVPLSTDQFAGLSKEQQAVVMAIMRGSNVFFSGCAGTGKSHLLKLLTQFLPQHSTFFTASTGLAAVNIGGSTLHSFGGIGLGEGSAEKLGFKARGNKRARQRWLDCKVLVIDEISMISGQLFDKLEQVARFVRSNEKPFGGIQLVLSGDFLQLPPVKATKPTFRADCWDRCVNVRIVLTKVFRQLGDPTFINLLGNLRMGVLSLKDECILKKSHYNPLGAVHGVMPTKLNALKRDTADENAKFLAELPGSIVTFRAKDRFQSEAHMQLLAKDCPAAAEIYLKQGAQVMLLKNIDPASGLCNGARGIVLDFVRVHAEDGGIDGEGVAATGARAAAPHNVIQMDDNGCAFPSAAAAAGSSSSAAAAASSTTPGANGSTGSTVPSGPSDGVGINPNPYWADSSKGYYGGQLSGGPIGAGNADEVYYLPRVQFDNGVVRVIESDRFEIVVQDVVLAERVQVPLTLAWALTIHKSQGMTLERAEINAQGMFENGQLYVAVSRVKSIPGLRLRGFTRDCMRTDQSVVEWYKRLAAETERSTQELLKDVDKEFPHLATFLEEQKKKQESEAKEGEEGPGAAAATASSSSAAAGAASNGSQPSVADAFSRSGSGGSASSSGSLAAPMAGLAFTRASTLVPAAALPAAAAASSSAVVKKEPIVKRESTPLFQHAASRALVGPPPQAFRSPVKDPAAAAVATAAAAAELAAVNAANHPSSSLCCVCLSHKAEWIVLDCMHLCLCGGCQEAFGPPAAGEAAASTPSLCPMCREPILKIKKVFAS